MNTRRRETPEAYALVAVAAEVMVWGAVGRAMYFLHEAARRGKSCSDASPILMRATVHA